MGDSRLAELARRHGVATAYEDVWGERHEASDATLRAVLAAMHEAKLIEKLGPEQRKSMLTLLRRFDR